MHYHMTQRLFFYTLFVSIGITSTLAPVAHAQIGALSTQTSIEVRPDPPKPFTDVTLTLKAYSFDPIRALISWYVNGKLVSEGVGLRSISTRTGAAGSATTVQVVAQPPNGIKSVTTHVLRPAYVAVTWEAETYTPFFYKGKAMASPGATVTYVALPFFADEKGKPIDPSKLVYTWKRRYITDQNASGVGKRTYTVREDLRNAGISVEVATFDKTVTAQADATLTRVQPIPEIYPLHPLLGIRYEHALAGSYSLASDESSIIVEPYFFSVEARDAGNITYAWSIDGTPSSQNSSIIFRTTGNAPGEARIILLVRHLSEALQSARKLLTVQYGGQQKNETPASTEPQNTYAPF